MEKGGSVVGNTGALLSFSFFFALLLFGGGRTTTGRIWGDKGALVLEGERTRAEELITKREGGNYFLKNCEK